MYCQLFIVNYATASLMRDFWLHLNIIQINLAAVFGLHKNCSLFIIHWSFVLRPLTFVLLISNNLFEYTVVDSGCVNGIINVYFAECVGKFLPRHQ